MVYENVNWLLEVLVRDRKEFSGSKRPEKFPKWLSDYQIFKKNIFYVFSDVGSK